MKFKLCFCFTIFMFLSSVSFLSNGQQNEHEEAYTSLTKRGEVILRFDKGDSEKAYLSQIISVDRIDGDTITAYANSSEFSDFLQLHIPYMVGEPAGSKLLKKSADSQKAFYDDWDTYPSYDDYLNYLSSMAETYPEICCLDTIGLSEDGRLLIALKISDLVAEDEAEPEFFYTSTMHGDEVTGMMLMLRLIDHLLSNYGTDPEITSLIDTIEIYINPNANPDGTYAGGNSSIEGATRYNSNFIDINRNFPDPQFGNHPDGNAWQIETEAMMAYHAKRKFVLSANYHGGAEVLNYPWDTWSRAHADENWFNHICRQYADTVKSLAGQAYFSDVILGGVINGYDWYPVAGGRQDYVTYFHLGREVTIEVSSTKMPDPTEMPVYWEWNRSAMLSYLKQCTYGLHGRVTDGLTGDPLAATLAVVDHDKDNSHIRSDSLSGEFHRMLEPGEYSLLITKEGYRNKTIPNVMLADYESKQYLNIQLEAGIESLHTQNVIEYKLSWMNETHTLAMETSHSVQGRIVVFNSLGQVVHITEINLLDGGSCRIALDEGLKSGMYYAKFQSEDAQQKTIQFSILNQ